ncbi:Tubulin-folding cofactor E [Sesamum angolense]|uniref:Tubulin-folding cofactor E n=1 Tax=Sesamum angolense TaxID=2727404 RepID=A0AAE2BN20_9LAMI|nr:Tubulin-folding cofactor E [Sesamum angolense]
MQTTSNSRDAIGQPETAFRVGQRVHFIGQPRRIGTVKYVGPVEGYSGNWIGVDWDADGEGKHDGSHNGIRYFTGSGPNTASFVRPHNLSTGISLLEALEARYRTTSTKEEEDLKELDLTGNLLADWEMSSTVVQGFNSLRLLNLENNCISAWDEIVKLSQLPSLEQLFLNDNNLNHVWYPDCGQLDEPDNGYESHKKTFRPFKTLRSLSLAYYSLRMKQTPLENDLDIRLSDNPVADLAKGGVPRFVFIARLAKVEILNGSEVGPRERKESEIRFDELKKIHGIEDERPSTVTSGPQKMASGLISISLKCVGASIGEKPPLAKKLPATTTVGKLKNLCESFFKLKSIKPILYLQEEGSPLPTLLDDDMASLIELGIGNESTILVDELLDVKHLYGLYLALH